jgi:hypothetical protein
MALDDAVNDLKTIVRVRAGNRASLATHCCRG